MSLVLLAIEELVFEQQWQILFGKLSELFLGMTLLADHNFESLKMGKCFLLPLFLFQLINNVSQLLGDSIDHNQEAILGIVIDALQLIDVADFSEILHNQMLLTELVVGDYVVHPQIVR